MYRKRTWNLRRGRKVVDDHTGSRRRKGEKRGKREKPSTEAKKALNHKRVTEKCLMRLREYFKPDDYFVTMMYGKDERPANMEEAKKDRKAIYEYLKREYKKRGEELRWICNIECGQKGAWHLHWIINRIPDTDLILRQAWERIARRGSLNIKLLHEQDGNFSKLAEYICKDPDSTARAKDAGGAKAVLRESDMSCSRNMPIPEPEVKEIRRSDTWGTVRVPEGFYLDKDSYYEGINPFTGYRYREYWLLPLGEQKCIKHTFT